MQVELEIEAHVRWLAGYLAQLDIMTGALIHSLVTQLGRLEQWACL